jgi:hypothetical protein
VSYGRPIARGNADPWIPAATFDKRYGGKSMIPKQPSLRGTAWFVVLTVVVGVLFGGAARLSANAKWQDAAEQEKDKKEEKRDEKKTDKKDEKKGLPLKSDRKIEFTTDESTWLSVDVSPNDETQVWPEQKKLETLWFWNKYDVPKADEPLNYGKTMQP